MNGLYIAASGAASQVAQLDTVANNLANSNTPGFRRFLNVMQSIEGNGSPYQYAASGGTPMIDMAQGPLVETNNPLDLAITGSAFLTVQTPDGNAYTRNGELQVSPDGTLLAAGHPLLSEAGSTIILPAGAVVIGGDGTINVNNAPIARLQLVDPSHAAMEPAGPSLYRPAGVEKLPPATNSQVHQGFLENPTGSDVSEMVSIVDVSRNYESAMKTIQDIDGNQNQAIQAFTLQA
jgi:flagellar basal-body rod protein FlgF